MNYQAFFKTWGINIVIALALFLISSIIRSQIQISQITDIWSFGFPFVFRETWGPCQVGQVCESFSYLFLLLDIVAWFAVVSIAQWALSQAKRQRITQSS